LPHEPESPTTPTSPRWGEVAAVNTVHPAGEGFNSTSHPTARRAGSVTERRCESTVAFRRPARQDNLN
jgi:hypothetical protein